MESQRARVSRPALLLGDSGVPEVPYGSICIAESHEGKIRLVFNRDAK